MAQRGEATAVGIGQAQLAAVEVGFQKAVFLDEVGDDPPLVPQLGSAPSSAEQCRFVALSHANTCATTAPVLW